MPVDLTLGLGALVMCVILILVMLWGFDKIGKSWFQVKQSTKRLIGMIAIVWILAIAITSGWIGAQPAPETGGTGVIPADYVVTATTNSSAVYIDESAKRITVMLDMDGVAFELGSQYANITFQLTRTDAGTADSAVILDVSSVATWVDRDGYTRYTLAKYPNGQYYADWVSGGSSPVNDKISVVIDREQTSVASATLKLVADATSWATANVGQTHTVTVLISDVASGFSQTWTVNFTLVNNT